MKPLSCSGLCLILFITFSNAQSIQVIKTEQIPHSNPEGYYYPKFTPDDSKIIFTQMGFKGLFCYDPVHDSITQLTDLPNAGYDFVFSPNGKTVYFRSDEYQNRIKYSTIMGLDMAEKLLKRIENPHRKLSAPKVLKNGDLAVINEGAVMAYSVQKKYSTMSSMGNEVIIDNQDQGITLYQGSSKKIITPFGKGNYIWASLSPDKTRLLFTLAGQGTYISDLEGHIQLELGYANAPKWSPDGQWIIYMIDKDDGHRFVSSDLYVRHLVSGKVFPITQTEDQIEMYPEWSSLGNRIVYHTENGKLYLITISYSK